MNKIISYIGFAIKANKVIVGQSAIKRTIKPIQLVLVCSTASDNLKDLAKNVAIKHNCTYIVLQEVLGDLTHLKDVKIIAITDENLSTAIKANYKIDN